jgi:hypothetical protein
MDDLAAWVARAVYYQATEHSTELDRVIAERMDDLRGCSGTPPWSQSGT